MSILLDQLVKRYGTQFAVNHVSLGVADGEFFVLLGPSGSGKSTVLRMVAGLTDIEAGRVLLHGRDVTKLPPQQRGIGFVFQNYSLFRHMTVAQNVEFGLRIRGLSPLDRRRRRDELLELVGLAGLGGRLPRQLSGGQQQRVALARALAPKPEVLLLDEPFGALDAPIRAELRRALLSVQRELSVTTIFVTHDQEEAFELADRMGVMSLGRLLEVGPPDELYLRPQTEFVATFLGTANLMVGECSPSGVQLGPVHFPFRTDALEDATSRRVQVLFRPEDVAVKDSPDALSWPLLGQGVVEHRGFSGSLERLRLRLPSLSGVRAISPPAPFGGDYLVVEAARSQHQARRYPLKPGDVAWVGVRRMHALTHPGLNFLLLTDGSPASQAAVEMGTQLARLAHARVTLLSPQSPNGATPPEQLQSRESIGAGLAAFESRTFADSVLQAAAVETGQQPYDLLVHGLPPRGQVETAERLLQTGEHHLLLVPRARVALKRILICVAIGEPGKDEVLFAGRLGRHIGSEATLLSVLLDSQGEKALARAERFLAKGAQTMLRLGVPCRTVLRRGVVRKEILAEAREGGHDLLVLGTPLSDRPGRISLDGLVSELIEEATDRPLLLIRSHLVQTGRV